MKTKIILSVITLLLFTGVAFIGTSFAQQAGELLWQMTCPAGSSVTQYAADGATVVECWLEAVATATSTSTVPAPTATVTDPPVASGAFIVDHTNVDLFDRIPDEYILAASQIDMAFANASVGENISSGLSCLGYPSAAAAPSHCRRPTAAAAGFTPDVKYDRSNWDYLQAKGPNDFYALDLSGYDVKGFLPNYLMYKQGESVEGVMAERAEMMQYLSTLDNVLYFTGSLSRDIGTTASMLYNAAVRIDVEELGGVLVDVADIESHAPDGSLCFVDGDPNPDTLFQIPVICSDYTSEDYGGHLGNMSLGKIKIAKAVWVAMAVKAGWNPYGSPEPTPAPTEVTPVPPTPVPTEDPPTSTPEPTTTLEPTPAPTSTSTQEPVPGEPYRDAPLCEDHDPKVFHTLWNAEDGCHYNHTHGEDPHAVDDIFGTEIYDLMGGEISYPWHTAGENEPIKHKSYMWFVGRDIGCFSQFDDGCVAAYRIFVHNDLFNVASTHHSALVEAIVCSEEGYAERGLDACGFYRVSGHQSTGDLLIDTQVVVDREQMPDAPQQVMQHHDFVGQKGGATWYPAFYSLMRVSTQTDDMFGYWKFPVGQEIPVSGVSALEFERLPGNASKTNVHLLGLGFNRPYGAVFDADGDGLANYDGFINVHTGELGGMCTGISEHCAPIKLVNVPVMDPGGSTSFQFRAGVKEFDICFNVDTGVREECRRSSEVNASGWIEFPGFTP